MVALLDQVNAALRSADEPLSALGTLRATTPLAALLELIRRDRSSLSELASCSYRHRNGFDKIVLASAGNGGMKLVLHVWPTSDLPDQDHIHDHRWDFASVVLVGSLKLDMYQADHCGESYTLMRYRSLPGPGNCALEPGGTMMVSVHASATMTIGSSYTWSADVLHRAYGVPGQLTATLIVQGPPRRNNTSVLVAGNGARHQQAGTQPVRQLRTDQLERTLAALAPDLVEQAWDIAHLPVQASPPQRAVGTGS